jgi:broad specificity phosphatase PhoE
MMPVDLVLVRHGESEGNVANALSRAQDHSAFTEGFKARPSSKWRLTEKGIWQAQMAGDWIRRNFDHPFGRYYVSEFIRAKETAYYLHLPYAKWYVDFYLVERGWGQLDLMSVEERLEKFPEEMRRKDRDGFFHGPPGGESMPLLCLRVDKVLGTLHRECTNMTVIIVCHGETMEGFRLRLERLTEKAYLAIKDSKDPFNKINKCQILHYTRRDPKSRLLASHLEWFRSICPWDVEHSDMAWRAIDHPKYSNEDLLAEVESFPRLIS